MSIKNWIVAAALLAAPLVATASASREVVQGRMSAVAQGGAEHGSFRMWTIDRGNGAHAEHIDVSARRLNVSGTTAANRPSFHLFMVVADGSSSADFGAMRVNGRGQAGFHFDTRRPGFSLPSGVTSITDFGGGTIEIRDSGGNAVVRGTIPQFGGGEQGSRVFGHAESRLSPVSSTFRGHGSIVARRQSLPRGVQEVLSVTCERMANSTTYTAVAIASDSTETSLGSFTTSNPRGLGGFRLATANGDSIPSGSVLNLAGQTVEVRDSGGTAVLTGTFPTIPNN